LWHVVCHFGCISLGFNYQGKHECTDSKDSYKYSCIRFIILAMVQLS
jgi:hypothetical protein